MRRYVCLLMLLTVAVTVFGKPRLKDLAVDVTLLDNGDVRITETRQMTVEDKGTECYIVVGNLNGSELRDLTVTDETGARFDIVTPWNTELSRETKTCKAGLLPKDGGYEICWGLGASGERIYITSYTVTALVKSYDDYDGFNYMFVTDKLDPPADHAKVTIHKESGEIPKDDVFMWAFRFKGGVTWQDGMVVAETTDDLDSSHAMIVMLQFAKGVLHPTAKVEGSFSAVKNRAFENSDYKITFFSEKWIREAIPWLLGAIAFLPWPIWFLWSLFRRWRFRSRVNSGLKWNRKLPCNANLVRASQFVDAYKYSGNNTKNLMRACMMRLVSVDALELIPQRGHSGCLIGIGELRRVRGLPDTKLLRVLHAVCADAADDDGILEPKRLKKWAKKHPDRMAELAMYATESRSMKECVKDIDHARQVFGLKKFLLEFRKANKREIDTSMWRDYLVYAELFGIADKVRKDMKHIDPDYFRFDNVLESMATPLDLSLLFAIIALLIDKGTKSLRERASRDSGGGGEASMGGGGGYSGGGSGGGIR